MNQHKQKEVLNVANSLSALEKKIEAGIIATNSVACQTILNDVRKLVMAEIVNLQNIAWEP